MHSVNRVSVGQGCGEPLSEHRTEPIFTAICCQYERCAVPLGVAEDRLGSKDGLQFDKHSIVIRSPSGVEFVGL